MENNNIKTSVGVDVSAGWVDVYIYPIGHSRRATNDIDGLSKLAIWISSYDPDKIVCEATGGLERKLINILQEHSMSCVAVNPNRISAFRQASGKLAKTDILDAQLIAEFAYRMDIAEKKPLTSEQEALKNLASRRRQLVEMQTMERNRLKRSENDLSKSSIHKVLAVLAEEQVQIESQMLVLIKENDATKRKMEILTSIPGIGSVVALTLISDMPELGSLNEKQAASLAGIAPQSNQSGIFNGKSTIRAGRKCVRTALYMGALSAKRYNEPIKIFFDRLVQNGKPKKLALIAASRKLLIQANYLLKIDKNWELNRPTQNKSDS